MVNIELPVPAISKITLDLHSIPTEDNPYIADGEPETFVNDFGKLQVVPGLIETVQTSLITDIVQTLVSTNYQLQTTVQIDFSDFLTSDLIEDENIAKYVYVTVFEASTSDLSRKILSGKYSVDALKKLSGVRYSLLNIRDVETGVVTPLKDVSFTSSDTNPEYLAYFAVSSIDLDQLTTDLHIDPTIKRQISYQGGVSGEIAIEKSTAKTTIKQFFDKKTNQIWTGYTKILNDKVYPIIDGKVLNSPLTFKTVSSDKIKDLRKKTQIKDKIDSEISTFENAIDTTITSFHQQTDVPSLPWLSEGFLARDKYGNCRGGFFLDVQEVLKSNSTLGYFLEGVGSKVSDAILSLSLIKSLKIYRNRISETASNTSVKDFDETSAPEIIASSSDLKNGFLSPNSLIKTKKNIDVLIGAVRELGGITDKKNLRTITFIDDAISEIGDGKYQYSVDLEIQDGIILFIQERIAELQNLLGILSAYYVFATVPNYFDEKRNSFTDAFSNAVTKRYSQENSPWRLTTSLVTDTLRTFSALSETELKDFVEFVGFMLKPKTGSPDGIETVIEITEKVLAGVQTKYSIDDTIDNVSKKTKGTSASINPTIIRLSSNLEGVFNSNVLRRTGYNFLGGQSSNKTGWRVMSEAAYEERIGSEISQFVLSETTLPTSKTSFLSLAEVDLTSKNFSFLDANVSTDISSELKIGTKDTTDTEDKLDATTLQKTKISLSSASEISSITSTIEALTKAQAARSISFPVLSSNVSSDLLGVDNIDMAFSTDDSSSSNQTFKTSAVNGLISSKEIVGTSDFNTKNTTFGGTDDKTDDDASSKISLTSLTAAGDKLKTKISGVSDTIADFPVQITGFGSSESSKSGSPDDDTLKLKYLTLKQVEYLKDFKISSEGDLLLKSPEWGLLTSDVLLGISSSKRLLCRLQNWHNSDLDAGLNDSLPSYDDYFVVQIEEDTVPTNTLTQTKFDVSPVLNSFIDTKTLITEKSTSATPISSQLTTNSLKSAPITRLL